MSQYFNPDFGELEVTPYYADNETFAQELKFSVPASSWSEFQESALFRELMEYLHSPQIQDMKICNHQLGYIEETSALLNHSTHPDSHESFLARVRKRFFRQPRM